MPLPQINPESEQKPCWLTPECERVQGDILHLAEALSVAALAEFEELKQSFLSAIREFRNHLRDHADDVEAPGGVCECVASNWPQLGNKVNQLCREHAGLELRMAGLEQRLQYFDASDPTWAESVRQSARHLADQLARHQATARAIVDRTSASGSTTPREEAKPQEAKP
jgi:hypothetical protein